jgi:hypothetical protein
MCPPLGQDHDHAEGRLICHCLVVETDDGLVLVDAGFGRRDVADPGSSVECSGS